MGRVPGVNYLLEVHEVHEAQNKIILIYEYVEMNTLSKILLKQRSQAMSRSKSYTSQIIQSLLLSIVKIHSKGVIHRNLCPSNIFVSID
jgi:serine/threonine protein kinase